MEANCKNCKWNKLGICEHTSWKTGKPVQEDPACGPSPWNKKVPIGWKQVGNK